MRPRLQLLEQADILDGDHGLGGERFEQFYLLVREGTNLSPANGDCADRRFFFDHRYGEKSARTGAREYLSTFTTLGFCRLDQTRNMDARAFQTCLARRIREACTTEFRRSARSKRCNQFTPVLLYKPNLCIGCFTQPGSIFRDNV